MAPFVIFTGKKFQSTWKGSNALPDTPCGVGPNGWMTSEFFYECFVKFTELVSTRPLLLILDGQLTHLTLGVIEKAISEDITIVKLPPHVTDCLQPLDVSCFSPLKSMWESKLNEWASVWGPRTPMRKGVSVDKLCEIWRVALSEKNIKAGFAATGTHPTGRSRFPTERLDQRLLKAYDRWVANGKLEGEMLDLAVHKCTPVKCNSFPSASTPKLRASPHGKARPNPTPRKSPRNSQS